MMTFVKAVAYELQPIDMSSMAIPPLSEVVEYSTSLTKQAGQVSSRGLKSFAKFLSRRTAKEWAAAITFIGYWKGVVYLHRTLDAGPSVLMITALVIIFSVGLGDTKDGNTLSAYSGEFNSSFDEKCRNEVVRNEAKELGQELESDSFDYDDIIFTLTQIIGLPTIDN